MTQKALVWVGRIAILIFALIAYFMSVFIPGLLVTIGLVALSGTAQVFIPTAGALFWKRSSTAGAITGLLAGTGILILLTFVPSIKAPFGMHSGLFSLIVNLLLFVVVSIITPKRNADILARFDKQNAAYNKNFA